MLRSSLRRGVTGGLLLLLCTGCPGELPRNDGKPPASEGTLWPDLPAGKPDQPGTPAPDGYAATPFGCLSSEDCFGQECCPTVWGVRLCAPTCDP